MNKLKPSKEYGFDPVGIYGIYDKEARKIIAIQTFANDKVAKANITKDVADQVELIKLAEIDLYDAENMTLIGEAIMLENVTE